MGFWPSDFMTTPNSLVVIDPLPSLSNSENASLYSEEKNKSKLTFVGFRFVPVILQMENKG